MNILQLIKQSEKEREYFYSFVTTLLKITEDESQIRSIFYMLGYKLIHNNLVKGNRYPIDCFILSEIPNFTFDYKGGDKVASMISSLPFKLPAIEDFEIAKSYLRKYGIEHEQGLYSLFKDGVQIWFNVTEDKVEYVDIVNITSLGFCRLNRKLFDFQNLPDDIVIKHTLNLRRADIERLGKNWTINGDLHLTDSSIETIQNIAVDGILSAENTKSLKTIKEVIVDRDLYLNGSSIETLQNIIVHGNLYLNETKSLENIEELIVDGDLHLNGSSIKKLPKITVQDLYIKDTNINIDQVTVLGKIHKWRKFNEHTTIKQSEKESEYFYSFLKICVKLQKLQMKIKMFQCLIN